MKPIVLYNSISNDVFIYSVCHIYNVDHFDKDVLIWGEWLIPQFRKKRHSTVYEGLTDVEPDLATAFYQQGKWFSSALQKFPCVFILMVFSYGYWCRRHRVRAPNSFIVKNNTEGRWEGGTPTGHFSSTNEAFSSQERVTSIQILGQRDHMGTRKQPRLLFAPHKPMLRTTAEDNTYTTWRTQAGAHIEPSPLLTSAHGTRRDFAHSRGRKVNSNPATNP